MLSIDDVVNRGRSYTNIETLNNSSREMTNTYPRDSAAEQDSHRWDDAVSPLMLIGYVHIRVCCGEVVTNVRSTSCRRCNVHRFYHTIFSNLQLLAEKHFGRNSQMATTHDYQALTWRTGGHWSLLLPIMSTLLLLFPHPHPATHATMHTSSLSPTTQTVRCQQVVAANFNRCGNLDSVYWHQ